MAVPSSPMSRSTTSASCATSLVADGTRTTTDRRAVPTTTFITPLLAHVGLTEKEASAEGLEIKVASKRVDTIAAMPRARIVGDTRGMVKVVVDAATDLVLGATIFCVDSQEIINLVALAMRHAVTGATEPARHDLHLSVLDWRHSTTC